MVAYVIDLLGLDVSVGYSEKWHSKTTWNVGYSIITFSFNASFTVSDVSILKKLNYKQQVFQRIYTIVLLLKVYQCSIKYSVVRLYAFFSITKCMSDNFQREYLIANFQQL